MLIEDAYLITFYLLNDYYNANKDNSSLSSLLSDMDPYLFADRKAADPAMYDEWYNIISKYAKNGEVKNEDIINALRDFLTYYQNEFEYELEEVILYIDSFEKS